MNDNVIDEALSADNKKSKTSIVRDIYDWLEIFIVSVAVVFIMFSFVARIAVVDGSSMLPTLHNGDKLVVAQLFYKPKQGDIVVCQSETYGLDRPLVKRVIATGGQTVTLDVENWRVLVDGIPLSEDYVFFRQGVPMHGWDYDTETITVKEGHVFVMGDNRNDSLDSRSFSVGQIDERYIVGKVIFRFTPIKDFGFIK